ncbi:HD domain-containing protein [Candidatus Nomurabacteria bacterium]|nr:HD domain-containing protein [Candidatus Nomurabacteria bacterium]
MKHKEVADFLFEVGILAKTPRSGFHFLGSGQQSVAEHLNRLVYVGYALAMLDGTVDVAKVMKMCLFSDLSESRISDLNYVHQKYNERLEDKANKDITDPLPFGQDMHDTLEEYKIRESRESLLAKDADNIELVLSLKEQVDIGNKRAESWIPPSVARIKTAIGKELVQVILDTPSDDWWYGDKQDSWWVDRDKEV